MKKTKIVLFTTVLMSLFNATNIYALTCEQTYLKTPFRAVEIMGSNNIVVGKVATCYYNTGENKFEYVTYTLDGEYKPVSGPWQIGHPYIANYAICFAKDPETCVFDKK